MPIYRCEMCRETIYSILIRRIGLRIHLCGFAPRREPIISQRIPKALNPILSDAEQAVSEGDTYAAFYHLRTLIEHYAKTRLDIAITKQIRGDELVEKYYETILPEVSSMLPSLTTAWDNLSRWLHTRTGEPSDYQNCRDEICKHIELVAALGEKALRKNSGA